MSDLSGELTVILITMCWKRRRRRRNSSATRGRRVNTVA
jgi:hypothetical protein